MIQISAPNKEISFTSGQGYDATFRLNIIGDLSGYSELELQAELEDCDSDLTVDEETPLDHIITLEFVNRGATFPATVYLPQGSQKVRAGIQVYRGPLHPHEFTTFEVELSVYGKEEDRTKRYLGSDTVTLLG